MEAETIKKAIVIVEDNPAIAEIIKDTLDAEPDYQSVTVADGSLAIEVIRSLKTDLILLDFSLPGLTGLEVYDILKQDDTTRHIPILFITANADSSGFERRGITEILHKPFNLDELLERVAVYLRPS